MIQAVSYGLRFAGSEELVRRTILTALEIAIWVDSDGFPEYACLLLEAFVVVAKLLHRISGQL